MADSPEPGSEPGGETVDQARNRLMMEKQLLELQINSYISEAANYRSFADYREGMANGLRTQVAAIDQALASL